MIGLMAGAAEAAGLIQTRRRRSMTNVPVAVPQNGNSGDDNNHKAGNDDNATSKEKEERAHQNKIDDDDETEKHTMINGETNQKFDADDDKTEEDDEDDEEEEYEDYFSISVLAALSSLVDYRKQEEQQSTNLASSSSTGNPQLQMITITESSLAEELINPSQSTLDSLLGKRESGEIYEGPYAMNGVVRHGDGAVCVKKDGSKFLGSYLNDEPFYGTLVTKSYTYNGTFLERKFHSFAIGGVCALAQSDGIVYVGEFARGKYHGVGKMMFPDGSVYTGNFDAGQRHGIGTLVIKFHKEQGKQGGGKKWGKCKEQEKVVVADDDNTSDSASYSGVWCRDLRDGEGTEITISGEVYQGQFSQDHRQGSGMVTCPDGTIREGTWRAGIPVDGPNWVITYPDGAKYNGDAVNYQPHGHGTMKYPGKDGEVYTGEWKNGARHGKGLAVYENGGEFNGWWDDDKPVEKRQEDSSSQDEKEQQQQNKKDTRNTNSLDKENGDNKDENTSKRSLARYDSYQSGSASLSTIDVEDDSDDTLTTRDSEYSGDSEINESVNNSGTSCSEDDGTKTSSSPPLHTYENGDTYEGSVDEDGHRQGHGKYTEQKSGSTYEGAFKDSMRHGHGVLITEKAKYVGMFVNDKREGEGTLVFNDSSSYKGEFTEGEYHGHGTLCESDGRVYDGMFMGGFRSGNGKETYPDGTVYQGNFSEGKRHGLGTLEEGGEEGRVIYQGMWSDDKMDGEGVLYDLDQQTSLSNGSGTMSSFDDATQPARFEGSFLRGQRSGHGIRYEPDGTVLCGQWLRDVPVDGEWSVTKSDQSKYSGGAIFLQKDDSDVVTTKKEAIPVPNGQGEMTYINGDVYTGSFVVGKRHGNGVCIFANGDKWEGTWLNDQFGEGCKGSLTLANGTIHTFGADGEKKKENEKEEVFSI